jgi:hypothetical protein
MEKIVYQHGDILLKQSKLPVTAKFLCKATKGFVVEKGEGVHLHTLVEGDVDVYMDGETMYLKVNSPAKIDHEEHKIQTIRPGIVKKILEREWNYEDMESRKTQD